MNAARDRLVDDYLARLDRALAGVPRERRREIVEEISGHIAEARAGMPPGDEAALRTLLDRLGDPAQIAADAREDAPRTRRGWHETVTIVLLLVGGFIGGVGWLVGVVLLWLSSVWTTRDKVIGTLLVPGGLALVTVLAVFAPATKSGGQICTAVAVRKTGTTFSQTTAHCTPFRGTPLHQQLLWDALFVALLVAPILSAVYLARRSRRLVSA